MPRGRLTLAACAALLLVAAWLAADSPHATALTNCETASEALDSEEMLMLQLVNAARSDVGAPPLAISPNLSRAAAWKSEDSSNGRGSFSHTDSLGRSPSQRARDCGYPGQAGENIAYGFPGTQATFDAFMGSPGHRANIENTAYVVIGLGHSGSSWAMAFGLVDDSGAGAPGGGSSRTAETPVPTDTPRPTNTPRSITSPTATPTATRPAPPPTPTAAPDVRAVTNVIELERGLNLVTFNAPATAMPAAILSLGSDVDWVYTWDGERWLRYFPGSPNYVNSLDVMRPGVAYFVKLRRATTWSY